MRVRNKVIVITGGAGGIGLATAKIFLNEGAKGIVLVDLRMSDLEDAASKLASAGKIHLVQADVSKSDDVKRYTEMAITEFGRIDVLFLNAGTEGIVKPITEYDEDTYDKVMAVNMKGVWLGMKFAFPHMQNTGGSIIITSSVAGIKGTANVSAYVGSKHGVNGLMKVGALEGAPYKIRVNSIHPSPVDNRMMRSLEDMFAPGQGEEVKKGFEKMLPLGRYATNDEIANAALYLASDESSFVTGAQFVVDGGMTT